MRIKERGLKTPSFLGATFAVIFTHLAMLLYVGGNPLESGTRYSFTKNFLSDLGLITTYNHHSQPGVVASFAIGLWAAAFAIYHWYKPSLTRSGNWAKWLSVACLGLLPLVPSDVFFWPHRILVIAALFGFAATNASLIYRRYTSWYLISLTLFQVAYLAFIFFGPMPAEARVTHVILQKVAIYTQLFLLLTPVLATKKLPKFGS